MSKLDKAYNYLIQLLEDDGEYPDCEFKAACKYNVSCDDLREMYDRDSQ